MKKLLVLLPIIMLASFACSAQKSSPSANVVPALNTGTNQATSANVPPDQVKVDFETFKKDLSSGKTYTSLGFGILFKYPSYLEVKEDSTKVGDVVDTIKVFDSHHQLGTSTTYSSPDDLVSLNLPMFQILIEPARQAKSCYDLNGNGALYSDMLNIDGYTFTINGVEGYHGCLGGGLGNGFHLEVLHNNYTYTFYSDSLSMVLFGGRDDSNAITEILKTVKFTK